MNFFENFYGYQEKACCVATVVEDDGSTRSHEVEVHEETFLELTEKYSCTVLERSRNTNWKLEKVRREFPMCNPILASYQQQKGNEENNNYSYDVQTIFTGTSFGPTEKGNIPVEMRGITLRQLRAVKANIERRCIEEKWVSTKDWQTLLSPENVNVYDIDHYIIRPFTQDVEKSFVECLPSTAGTQPPRFFISHWWGESFFKTMDCVEQLYKDFQVNNNDETAQRGGGMILDTPIWFCAFANNQHKLEEELTTDPSESGFAKAMQVAEYRTVSILDEQGTAFERIWCIFELHQTLIHRNTLNKKKGDVCKEESSAGLWTVYTSHDHVYESLSYRNYGDKECRKAIGIVPGGCPGEQGFATILREQAFPATLIDHGLDIRIQNAKSSKETDRENILKYIGNKGNFALKNMQPFKKYVNYDKLNKAVKGEFASNMGILRIASTLDNKSTWRKVMNCMSSSFRTAPMKFSFAEDNMGWDHLSTEQAANIVFNLPPNIVELTIESAHFGPQFLESLLLWLRRADNLKVLYIEKTMSNDGKHGGRDFGRQLAGILKSKETIEKIKLYHTDFLGARNTKQWAKALKRMKNLKKFECIGLSDNVSKVTSTDESSCALYPLDHRQKIFWHQRDKVFPDACFTEKQLSVLLKATAHVTDVDIRR